MNKMIKPELIHLSNGIPVVLQHLEGTVAATYWWVKVGSVDESTPEAGFAHFLEHMLFKDASAKETGKASSGQMATLIESLGGDINAYTSFDQTVYHVTCAAEHWERVINAFGTIAKPQRFLLEDFNREREVILEELKKNEDSPGRNLFQTLFSNTFSQHPYGRPVIGFKKTLKAARLPQLEAFYQRNYVSGKMGLILVGPLFDEKGEKKKKILRDLEKHFGKKILKQKAALPSKKTTRSENPLRKESHWSVKPFDVNTPTFCVSFRVPDLEHEDIPALDLLSNVLSMGELSRLYQSLFYQSSTVVDVSGGLYVPKDPGMLYFQCEVSSMEKITPAVELLFQELKRIAIEGPTPEELSRVLMNAESERLYASQTADGMAGRLGFLRFIMGNLDYDQEYLERLKAVDALKLKEVAQKYFDHRRLTGVIQVPNAQADYDCSDLIQRSAKALPSPQLEDPEKVKKSKSKGKVQHLPCEWIQLRSGLKICYYPRLSSHVVSVHSASLGGLRLELAQPVESAERDWGASSLLALTWTKGSQKYSSQQIAALVEGKAASLDGFAGRNSVGLQLTGLARDWNALSQVYTEVLLYPEFFKAEVDHSKRIVEDSIRGLEDHSSQLCSKLFLETLFEKHPYGKLTHGTLESLKTLHSEKLKAFHRRWIRPENLVLSVSGAVRRGDLEAWAHDLDRRAAELQMLQGSSGVLPLELQDEPQLKAPRWVERSLGREQLHILVGGLGTTIHAEDRLAVQLLQTLLGGQSGRLFIELREKKSLAYTVAPVHFEGMERGYIGTYIACSPQKRDEALSGMKKVLETLAQKGPTAKEMQRAQEFFLGRRAMDLQGDTSLAAHYGLEALYGMPQMSEEAFSKKVRSVTARDIQKICKKYLVDAHQVTSVVG